MKEEIKEILDNTLEYLEGIDETRNTKILTTNETYILLDYITNLREYKQRNEKAINKVQEIKDHIDKSNFDGMTKTILIMALNEIAYTLNGKEGDKNE